MSKTLNGLILAGGNSKRMGENKALIDYHGKPQVVAGYELLTQCCDQVFLSLREEKQDEFAHIDLPKLFDTYPPIGPLGGILTALDSGDDAWLVIACDLPFLTQETLGYLIDHRRDDMLATAYKSSYDDKPEPLCAIYEPEAKASLQEFIKGEYYCPRKWLINNNVSLLDLPERYVLDNANTPDQRSQAMKNIKGLG